MARCNPVFVLGTAFREFVGRLTSSGYDLYEAAVAPGFWIRRGLDGTENEFAALLALVMEALDRPYLIRATSGIAD